MTNCSSEHSSIEASASFKRVIELDRYGELGRRANEIVGGFSSKVLQYRGGKGD